MTPLPLPSRVQVWGSTLAIAALLLVGVVGALVYERHHVRVLEDTIAKSQDQLRAARVEQVRTVAETIAVQMAAQGKVLTRTIESVRVDTLMLAPKTAADTATAVAQLAHLAVKHDSLQRECSEFKSTCQAYRDSTLAERRATDARIAGLIKIADEKRRRTWTGGPDFVGGAGYCATKDGLRPCVFAGIGARVGF